jgi:hypothetical protein
MINELEIQGYKGLKSVTLKGLRRLTLLGGRNNAGKTSVLEAFFLSRDWGNPEMLTRHLQWRGVEAYIANSDSWAPSFTNFELRNNKIQVRTRDSEGDRTTFTAQVIDAPTRTVLTSVAPAGNMPVAQNIRAPGEPSLRVSFSEGSRPVFEGVVSVAQGVPPYVLTPSRLEKKSDPVHLVLARTRTPATEEAMHFGKLDAEKRTDQLVSLLKVLEPRLNGLSVIATGPQPQVHADVEGIPRKIPVNLLGDGISRLLSMLVHMSNVAGGYLLVDEVENAFHHSTMPKIWQALYLMCKSQKCQLIATTHSYECLTAFASSLTEVAGDDFSYVRLDRTNLDVEAVTYDAAKLKNATEEGFEVR